VKQVKIELPDELADFINKTKVDNVTDFKRIAFMLYGYIDSDMIAVGKAAKLLGITKKELIEFYGSYGMPYISYSINAYKASEDKINEYYKDIRRLQTDEC